jgi:hypothetical protein
LAKICKETKAKISKYVAAYPELFITSSEDGTGIEALRAHLSGFASAKGRSNCPLKRETQFNTQNRIKFRQAIALLAGLPIISAVNRRKAIGISALFSKNPA